MQYVCVFVIVWASGHVLCIRFSDIVIGYFLYKRQHSEFFSNPII